MSRTKMDNKCLFTSLFLVQSSMGKHLAATLNLQGRRFTLLYYVWHYIIIVSLAVVSDCRASCPVFSSQKVCRTIGDTLVYCCELWSEKFRASFQVLRFPALNLLVKFSYILHVCVYLVWWLSDFELIFLLKLLFNMFTFRCYLIY